MEIAAMTKPCRQLAQSLRKRGDQGRSLLQTQVERLVRRLEGVGVKSEVVGAFTRESERYVEVVKVDVLILDAAGLREFRLMEIAWDEVQDAHVNLVFAHDLSQAQLAAVRESAEA